MFGGGDDDETTFTAIDAVPPASGVAPSKLPQASADLPAPPFLVRLAVPSLQIDAPIVTMGTGRDGAMQSPSSPFVVAWYDFSTVPGEGSNIVLGGHAEYPNYGAAVFNGLAFIQAGDELQLLVADGTWARYTVTSAETYDAETAPIDAITGHTEAEVVTLIATSSPGDSGKRLVVRGDRIVEGALAQ
jgi:LPXTG-site transpeptidase (sortase) family protein